MAAGDQAARWAGKRRRLAVKKAIGFGRCGFVGTKMPLPKRGLPASHEIRRIGDFVQKHADPSTASYAVVSIYKTPYRVVFPSHWNTIVEFKRLDRKIVVHTYDQLTQIKHFALLYWGDRLRARPAGHRMSKYNIWHLIASLTLLGIRVD